MAATDLMKRVTKSNLVALKRAENGAWHVFNAKCGDTSVMSSELVDMRIPDFATAARAT